MKCMLNFEPFGLVAVVTLFILEMLIAQKN